MDSACPVNCEDTFTGSTHHGPVTKKGKGKVGIVMGAIRGDYSGLMDHAIPTAVADPTLDKVSLIDVGTTLMKATESSALTFQGAVGFISSDMEDGVKSPDVADINNNGVHVGPDHVVVTPKRTLRSVKKCA
ncbi:hypothetical protein FH972_019288 [Carpinus fangiana]|uniref:Uncharacterized protein n=1 Tax=Carpinus fangiana TaxID=176857 RepID=A0A5N6RPN1_9ROSI|nr:hypothetical protein FH972_019288 [Carpinus fangiana]